MSTARFVPVSRVTLLALFLGTAALVFAHAHPLTGWAYADWAAASAEARQSLALAGVWAAGCAAWAASLHATPASATCPVSAVRNGAPLVRSQGSLLIGAAALGQVLGLAPLYLWCAIHTTYEADLRPFVIASGFAALIAFVGFGYLCGVLLPRLLATPAATVLTFGAIAFTDPGGSPLAPVWPFDVAAGLAEPRSVAILRVAFFLTTATLSLLASARWLKDRRTTPSTLAPAVAMLLPLVVVVLLTGANAPTLVHRDSEAQPRCTVVGVSQVCLHPARADLLPDVADLVRGMTDVVGPEAPAPARIYDATSPLPGASKGLALQLQYEDRERWPAFVALDLASFLIGTADCEPDSTGSGSSPGDVSSAAVVWLASQVDSDAAAIAITGPAGGLTSRLLQADPNSVASLLRRSLRDLRACRATIADLLPS